MNKTKDFRAIKGIATDFTILKVPCGRAGIDERTAESIISKGGPPAAEGDNPMKKLTEIMLENNFTMIPVTKNGKLVGIVDRCAIMEGYVTPCCERSLKERE